MKVAKWICLLLFLLMGGALLWRVLSPLFMPPPMDSSTAIIGGADGPTAIFVAAKPAPLAILEMLAVPVLLISWLILRHMAKKR